MPKKIEINLTDDEIKILEHDLLDLDEWVKNAVKGKIENCKKRAAIVYREILKTEGASMVPANDDVAAKQLFLRSDYENRKKRDEKESKILRPL